MAADGIGRLPGSPDRTTGDAKPQLPALGPSPAGTGVQRSDPGDVLASPGEFDPIAALAALADMGTPRAPAPSLADQLLDYVAPRLRDPDTLRASRVAVLLGLAADLLARRSGAADDLGQLGTAALGEELRLHRMLAERRANQIEG